MATRSSNEDSPIDESLLPETNRDDREGGFRRIGIGGFRGSLHSAASLFRFTNNRRILREPSMIVRETATEHLEERRSDWAYSKPVVVLDMIWNLVFIFAAAVILVLSRKEKPSMPLRLWITGYASQSVLHMACVWIEYAKRIPPRRGRGGGARTENSIVDEIREDHVTLSAARSMESANTMFSFIWWIIGFYWISSGGESLTSDAPQLYWLVIVFLAFDVFFVVFCVALACVVGIAVCCCLPCIIAILYAVADQEGATEEDIRQLRKYKFHRSGDLDEIAVEISDQSEGKMIECDTETPIVHNLLAEDAECCICLSAYNDGVELCELPCNHHFHSSCIIKWLCMNATCPLCKYNILRRGSHGREEV